MPAAGPPPLRGTASAKRPNTSSGSSVSRAVALVLVGRLGVRLPGQLLHQRLEPGQGGLVLGPLLQQPGQLVQDLAPLGAPEHVLEVLDQDRVGGRGPATGPSPNPAAPPPPSTPPVGSGSSAQRLDGHTTPGSRPWRPGRRPGRAGPGPAGSRAGRAGGPGGSRCSSRARTRTGRSGPRPAARPAGRRPRPGRACRARRNRPPVRPAGDLARHGWLLSDRLDGAHQVDQAVALEVALAAQGGGRLAEDPLDLLGTGR